MDLGSGDTSAEAQQLMIECYRAMSGSEKLALVGQMNAAVDALAEAGVRARFPGADEYEVSMRMRVLKYGPDLTQRAFGWTAP